MEESYSGESISLSSTMMVVAMTMMFQSRKSQLKCNHQITMMSLISDLSQNTYDIEFCSKFGEKKKVNAKVVDPNDLISKDFDKYISTGIKMICSQNSKKH